MTCWWNSIRKRRRKITGQEEHVRKSGESGGAETSRRGHRASERRYGAEASEDELKRAQLEVQKNEIVSRIDAEKNLEAVDEADTTLKQLKETYALKRAAGGSRAHRGDSAGPREGAMDYAQGNAAKMVVHSPMQGVVVYNTIWLGGRMERCRKAIR